MNALLHSHRTVRVEMTGTRPRMRKTVLGLVLYVRIKFFQQISSDCSYRGKQKRRDAIIRRPFTGNLVSFHASARLPPPPAPRNRNCALRPAVGLPSMFLTKDELHSTSVRVLLREQARMMRYRSCIMRAYSSRDARPDNAILSPLFYRMCVW